MIYKLTLYIYLVLYDIQAYFVYIFSFTWYPSYQKDFEGQDWFTMVPQELSSNHGWSRYPSFRLNFIKWLAHLHLEEEKENFHNSTLFDTEKRLGRGNIQIPFTEIFNDLRLLKGFTAIWEGSDILKLYSVEVYFYQTCKFVILRW